MSETLLNLIKTKSNYLKLHKLGIVSKDENKVFRNNVNNLIKKAKIDYHHKLFLKHRNDMKKCWRIINDIVSKNKDPTVISKIIFNNHTYIETIDISNIFNDYFCSIGDSLDRQIPNIHVDPLNYLNVNVSSTFFLNPVSSLEVRNYMKSLKNSKEELHIFSVSILKENFMQSDVLPNFIANLINKCFSEGKFPDILKKAVVVPIHKKGNIEFISNYRPISKLCFLSKIFEKVLKFRIMNYFENKNLFCPTQYGFQKGVSTQDAILHVTEKIYENLNNKQTTIAAFIDFSKCFDTLNRDILIRKLHAYGIRGTPLALISSYLSNRLQAVKINSMISSFNSINIGVPQGSVLGPLLFLIYVNELPFISELFKVVLFADDTTLLFENQNSAILSELCNRGLRTFHDWCCANRLSINISKTNLILFSNIYSRNVFPDIFLNNVKVNFASSVRFLGVEIDEKLKFKKHINIISSKVAKSTGILFKLRQYLPLRTLISVYRSLVETHLNYCTLIFGNAYDTHIHSLEVAQRKCIRIVAKQQLQAHTNRFFSEFKLLKFKDIYKWNLGIYMYKHRNSFETNNNLHGTRSSLNYFRPVFQRLNLTQSQSISYQAPSNWNAIPVDIQNLPSVSLFKRKYKLFLLSNYIEQS